MKSKFLYAFAGIAIIGLILVQFYGIFLMAWPFKYIEYKQDKLTVIDKRLHPGDSLTVQFSYCRLTDKEATVYVSILDGIVIRFPPFKSAIAKGCYLDKQFGLLTIPENTPPGTYHASVLSVFKVTSAREVTQTIDSEEFEVIK